MYWIELQVVQQPTTIPGPPVDNYKYVVHFVCMEEMLGMYNLLNSKWRASDAVQQNKHIE